MASRSQAVTAVPTALAGTVPDQQYSIQNLSTTPVFAAVAAAVPSASMRTFSIQPVDFLYQTPGAGELIYVWTPPGILEEAWVAYEESA